MLKKYITDLRHEFSGYNAGKLLKDILSGITVAAVALPLALAFGVSSGADAAAGACYRHHRRTCHRAAWRRVASKSAARPGP